MRFLSAAWYADTLIDAIRKALRMRKLRAVPSALPLIIDPPVSLEACRINPSTLAMRASPRCPSASASSKITGLASCPSVCRSPASVVSLCAPSARLPSSRLIRKSTVQLLPEPDGPDTHTCGLHLSAPQMVAATHQPAASRAWSGCSQLSMSKMSSTARASSAASGLPSVISSGLLSSYTYRPSGSFLMGVAVPPASSSLPVCMTAPIPSSHQAPRPRKRSGSKMPTLCCASMSLACACGQAMPFSVPKLFSQ